MPYYLGDVHAAMRKIEAACPNVILENWQDYGFTLIGYRHGPNDELLDHRTVFQPARPENGQPEIIADVDALIKEWST